MLNFIVATVIGMLGGAIIGNQLVFSIGFLVLIQRGFYFKDDIFNYALIPGLLFGIPVGSLLGIVTSLCLFQRGVQLKQVIIQFSMVILLSFSLAVYLEGRIRPPLVKAAAVNHLVQIQAAISNQVNLNVRDINGATALMVASEAGNFEIVKVLVQAGADINAEDVNGQTALMLAIDGTGFNGHPEIANVLIQAGVDVNAKNIKGWTALMSAASVGDSSTLTHLIQAEVRY
uniref:Ankyrin repeat domain-containing protein n=1 Tax=Desertifilum tharense IPPAS B-1220 TaxID=1781255 RepID=A0ACD5GNG4_9CYAN